MFAQSMGVLHDCCDVTEAFLGQTHTKLTSLKMVSVLQYARSGSNIFHLLGPDLGSRGYFQRLFFSTKNVLKPQAV